MLTSARKYRAFTLVEVLISLALLTIALLGVMGSIAYGTRHSRSGEELTEATQLARQILVSLQETSVLDTTEIGASWFSADSGLMDEEGVRREIDAAPLGNLVLPAELLSRYKRRVVTQRLSPNPNDHRYRLARAQVEIFWESKVGERQLEMTGVLSHVRP